MINYQIVVYYNSEDGRYFARIPAFPSRTAHGETPGEAVREAQVAQELWVEAATERGMPLPEPANAAGSALTV